MGAVVGVRLRTVVIVEAPIGGTRSEKLVTSEIDDCSDGAAENERFLSVRKMMFLLVVLWTKG